MKKAGMVFLVFMLVLGFAAGQTLERIYPIVRVGNDTLRHAWAGGLNTPQFNEADFNNDGLKDVHVFDRTGHVNLVFLNNGTADVEHFLFSPGSSQRIPSDLKDFVLLRDFNFDGAMDIYAFTDEPTIPGIRCYKGDYSEGVLNFSRFNFYGNPANIIYFPTQNGFFANLYVAFDDYPAVDDIDGDGDLDILTFSASGGYVDLYSNYSIESGFSTDSLIYRLKDDCWGNFYESGITEIIDLSTDNDSCAGTLWVEHDNEERLHVGSTLLTFDKENDGDKEVVLGDISFENLNLLTNNGTNLDAFCGEQENNFPANSVPVDIVAFPASFLLDLDNDGLKDLVASPNSPNNSENYGVTWFYKNTNSNENPVFEFQVNNFLVREMIDFGSGAQPTFVDYNADGLMDIVCGNFGYFVQGGGRLTSLVLYENVGTTTDPEYLLVDDDYLHFSDYTASSWNLAPAFGDLDEDGDLDLLVGEESGRLFFVENLAGAGNTFAFGTPIYNYKNIDIGQASSPQIIDLDRDGKMDMVIGERSGVINFFKNTGSGSIPDFTETPTNPFLGAVDVKEQNNPNGNCRQVFVDFNGEYHLFCASESGRILEYDNIDGNLDGTFSLLNPNYGEIAVGEKTSLAIANINGDPALEMLVGNARGGMSLFQSTYTAEGSLPTINIEQKIQVNWFPNPVGDVLRYEFSGLKESTRIVFYNTMGAVISETTTKAQVGTISTGSLTPGVYFVAVTDGINYSVQRIVKF